MWSVDGDAVEAAALLPTELGNVKLRLEELQYFLTRLRTVVGDSRRLTEESG